MILKWPSSTIAEGALRKLDGIPTHHHLGRLDFLGLRSFCAGQNFASPKDSTVNLRLVALKNDSDAYWRDNLSKPARGRRGQWRLGVQEKLPR